MKVIFLDIDGVLNVCSRGRDKYGRLFHQPFVDNLRNIIERTNAKIVISSTWRMKGLEVMKEMWKDRELAGEVIDITINSHHLVEEGVLKKYDKVRRGREIQDWIDENHTEIENYVILDDDNDMLPSQRGNFVRTANNINHPDSIDIGYGLTKICSEDAIRILNRP